jgi:hypothetical protein
MSTYDALSCSTRASRSANNSKGDVRLLLGIHDKYSTRMDQHTFVLLAQRLVLPDQLIALGLHILHFIVSAWPWQVLSPMSLLGAPCHRTPGACRISVGISPRHPAEGNNYLSTLPTRTRLLKGTVMYLHPLLSMPHRLHVASHRCRADEIIRQKLESTPTSRGGLEHRRRTDRLRVLDFR